MKNFFSEMDGVTLTYSDIGVNRDGLEYIKIYFERPTEADFDYLETELPTQIIKKSHGFSLAEQADLMDYLQKSAYLIWKVAGDKVA